MLKNVFLYLILLFLFAQVHSIGFNYMINGDLSSPPLTTASPTQTITTSILGWSGNNFQISLASAFSTIMCGNLPVLVVGTAPVTEALALPITEAYQLSFVWSTLNGSPFDDKTVATVRWNGQIVLTITPKAQLVNRETFQVHSHAGINTISLTAGTNRLLFSQFTLTHINMVINPIFNYPSVTTPTIFNSGILGW